MTAVSTDPLAVKLPKRESRISIAELSRELTPQLAAWKPLLNGHVQHEAWHHSSPGQRTDMERQSENRAALRNADKILLSLVKFVQDFYPDLTIDRALVPSIRNLLLDKAENNPARFLPKVDSLDTKPYDAAALEIFAVIKALT